jgi:hypothetical protein
VCNDPLGFPPLCMGYKVLVTRDKFQWEADGCKRNVMNNGFYICEFCM